MTIDILFESKQLIHININIKLMNKYFFSILDLEQNDLFCV